MLHSPLLLTMAHINVHLSISVNICQYLSYSPIWPAIPYQTCRLRLPWLLHFVLQGVQRDVIIIITIITIIIITSLYNNNHSS